MATGTTHFVLSELPLADRLAIHPELWNIELDNSAQQKLRADEPKIKALILSLLNEHRSSRVDTGGMIITGLAALFCFVGWRRELHYKKCRTRQLTE